jgi:hypothetical protein
VRISGDASGGLPLTPSGPDGRIRALKRLVVLLALACCLGAVSTPGATAAPKPLDSYCSPTGDYCIGVFGPKSDPVFELRTFSLTDQYKLCLKDGRYERQCGWWKLKHDKHGIYKSRVRLQKSYFLEDDGPYIVSAFYGDSESQLGRGLRFNLG